MKMITKLIASIGLIFALNAQAASVSYYLDNSNVTTQFPNGNNYLEVTIADGASGNIDFTVKMLLPLLSGGVIDSFGFNTTKAIFNSNISAPTSWTYATNKNQDGFGKFTSTLSATQNSATGLLAFSIIGITGDTVYDYVHPSTGAAGSSAGVNLDFAAHVIRLSTEDSQVTSSWFAGSTNASLPPSAVPVPAAAWLLGSGLIGLIGVSRRKAS
ncbi:VPLPA-CTERM sorting domain-containing protein [Sulfurirhabdus autotrophica]|uniref:Putative secreted protein n=1 Tax=Sulfurirhabdus autotrophica TaxID=1706046 RepID=A0A4R3XSD4_9PROT|nr:VPLPA-CTERM sorting domain-containing protein [Sulfurirhabdus autotrophica]TCV80121.1 putative secreted protein [Sulfurirhabdus autotrophica]